MVALAAALAPGLAVPLPCAHAPLLYNSPRHARPSPLCCAITQTIPYKPTHKDGSVNAYEYDASFWDNVTPLYYKYQGGSWFWSPYKPTTPHWSATSTYTVAGGPWRDKQLAGKADVAATNKKIISILNKFRPTPTQALPVSKPEDLIAKEVARLCYDVQGITNQCTCVSQPCHKQILEEYKAYIADVEKAKKSSAQVNLVLDVIQFGLDIGEPRACVL